MTTFQTFTGSCLCGGVHYRIESRLKKHFFCHCEQCRKLTGSEFASNLLLAPVEVTWLKGEALVKRFDSPGRSFTKVFCCECGSGLPFLNVSGTTLFIPAGSLDSAPALAVNRRIFWAERNDWLEAGQQATTADGFP